MRLTALSLEPLDGVVDYRRPNFLGVRTANALCCFFGRDAFGAPVGISIHMFADGIDPERARREWQQWLDAALA